LTASAPTTTGATVAAADPRNHLLWPLLAENVARGRGAEIALRCARRAISYGTLAAAARRGASEIDERCAPGSRLLIAARDQLRVGVALCAALGSRSVPLLADPISVERLRALAAEWRVAAAVVEPGTDMPEVELLEEGQVESWLDVEPASTVEVRPVGASDPAFWTFTSGTTGERRAVVHAHRGPVAAYRTFARGVLELGPEDVTIATAGLPFVYALGNAFFFPLMAGGTAVLPADLLLPTVLGELERHGPTILVAGPWSLASIVRLARRPRWVEAIGRLRCVLSAGEPLPPRVFHEWGERFGKEVLDNLGCSEMFNSFVSNRRGGARAGSLGSPVPGFELRIGGGPTVPGARGGLSVRGESRAVALGRGGVTLPPDGEWCETGDEVEVAADGSIVFLGRSDDRFKVEGRFLHPLEVEQVLAEVPGVVACLVVAERDSSGLPMAVAKVVPGEGTSTDGLVRRLLRHARARLEPFAVPRRVDLVDSLPRNARGKLERRGSKGA
jgi:acyl-coenzyme A synthetase/AMP-(fatty) acid ligase